MTGMCSLTAENIEAFMGRFAVLCLMFLVVFSIFLVFPTTAVSLSKTERVADLDFLVQKLDERYAFWWLLETSSAKLRRKYLKLIENNENEHEHYRLLNQLISELKDSHSHVYSPFVDYESLMNAGFKLKSYQDRYFISEVHVEAGRYVKHLKVGMELVAINGFTLEQKIARLRDWVNGTELWRKSHLDTLLSAISYKNKDLFTFRLADGSLKNIEIGIDLETDYMYRRTPASWSPEYPIVKNKLLNPTVGYIKIHGFSRRAEPAKKFAIALRELRNKKVKSLIIDLRNSNGGSGLEAIKMASAFFQDRFAMFQTCNDPSAQTCIVKEFDDLVLPDNYYSWVDKYQFSGPLVVLTSSLCRSSCELFAAILKYNKRAYLIGETTAGAGGGYACFDLPTNSINEGAQFCLTQQPFMVSDKLIQQQGVGPHLKLRESLSDLRLGKDTVLDAGIKYLTSSKDVFE